MHSRFIRFGLMGLLFLAGSSVQAVITVRTVLKEQIDLHPIIVVGKVEKIIADKGIVVNIEDELKGKAPAKRMALVTTPTTEAVKADHIPLLLKRIAPDQSIILFLQPRGKAVQTKAFTNGTWFTVLGVNQGQSSYSWALTNAEPYLRRTFKGSSAEMKQVIVDYLAGKAQPPEPNEKEEPGYGPEIAPKSGFLTPFPTFQTRGGLVGVIPTLGVGGPLVILALLFPAVFGGVLILFRQWIAFITVFSFTSMFLLGQWLLPNLLRGTWWDSLPAQWLIISAITLLGTLWAWRRQLTNLSLGEDALETPPKTEYLVLTILSALCLLIVFAPLLQFSWLPKPEDSDPTWNLTLVLTWGICGGLAYRLYRQIRNSQLALSTEGAMLGVTLLGCLFVGAVRFGGAGVAAEGKIEAGELSGPSVPVLLGEAWKYSPVGDRGLIVSSTLVEGDRVYAAVAHPAFKAGSVYCIDRFTGKEIWKFIDDGFLKEMISSPTLVEGRLYIGEGFHDDSDCKLYCIDAKSGEKKWEFKTTGQTESSPCVAEGKVFVGAGNDGIYALNAISGSKLWLFSGEKDSRLLRFGAGPVYGQGRVYAGTGVDRNVKEDPGETALFCIDASTGKQIWKTATPLPCWGTPVLHDGFLYVGIGNGDIFSDAETPFKKAGQVLCLDAKSGAIVWKRELRNGVIGPVSIDLAHVYAGCRDGNVYCFDRYTGESRWDVDLGSPIIAAPALATIPGYEQTAHVIALASAGKVACLDPHSGKAAWIYTVPASKIQMTSTPRVMVSRTTEGDRRQIYFGAGLGELTTGLPIVYCLEDFIKIQ